MFKNSMIIRVNSRRICGSSTEKITFFSKNEIKDELMAEISVSEICKDAKLELVNNGQVLKFSPNYQAGFLIGVLEASNELMYVSPFNKVGQILDLDVCKGFKLRKDTLGYLRNYNSKRCKHMFFDEMKHAMYHLGCQYAGELFCRHQQLVTTRKTTAEPNFVGKKKHYRHEEL